MAKTLQTAFVKEKGTLWQMKHTNIAVFKQFHWQLISRKDTDKVYWKVSSVDHSKH